MDRSIIYDQADVRDYDHLWAWRFNLIALSQLTQDLLGSTSTVVAGFAATADAPADLSINLAAGSIYQLADIDASAYGSLSSDTSQVLQQGIAAAQKVTLSTAGLSTGQSRWALVEATFSQTDAIPSDDPNGGLLPYLNTTNPSGPAWSGPNNSGAAQNTRRLGTVTIKVIYGNVATTGSEVPPNPDSGYVPLYLIDIAFGQTQVTQSQILAAGPSVGTGVPSNYTRAPFLAGLAQRGQYSQDVGSANAYSVGLVPALTVHVVGMPIRVKIANTNTGASTFNPGPGAVSIVRRDGSSLEANDLVAGEIATLIYDGTHYQKTGAGLTSSSSQSVFNAGSPSIATANNGTYTVQTANFTFPSFSPTGKFRLYFESYISISTDASHSGAQNFTTKILDSANGNANIAQSVAGAYLNMLVSNGADVRSAGISPNLYVPGASVSFPQELTQGGGNLTSVTITGGVLRLTALPG